MYTWAVMALLLAVMVWTSTGGAIKSRLLNILDLFESNSLEVPQKLPISKITCLHNSYQFSFSLHHWLDWRSFYYACGVRNLCSNLFHVLPAHHLLLSYSNSSSTSFGSSGKTSGSSPFWSNFYSATSTTTQNASYQYIAYYCCTITCYHDWCRAS